jgi:hypothetical protein
MPLAERDEARPTCKACVTNGSRWTPLTATPMSTPTASSVSRAGACRGRAALRTRQNRATPKATWKVVSAWPATRHSATDSATAASARGRPSAMNQSAAAYTSGATAATLPVEKPNQTTR